MKRLEDYGDVMTRDEVRECFQIPSLNSLYRRVAAHRFPPPAMSHPARWFRSDLQRWVNGDTRVRSIRRAS